MVHFFFESYRVVVSLADGHRRFWTVTLLELWHIHLIHQKIKGEVHSH